jgi:hypothetical protein
MVYKISSVFNFHCSWELGCRQMGLKTFREGPEFLFIIVVIVVFYCCYYWVSSSSFGVIMWQYSLFVLDNPLFRLMVSRTLIRCCNDHCMVICRIDIQANTRRFQSLFCVRALPRMKFYIPTSIGWTMSWFSFILPLIFFLWIQYLLEEVALEPTRLN